MISLARAQFPLLDQALLDHFLVTEQRSGMFADPSSEDVFQHLSNFFQPEVDAVGLVLALSLS